MADSMVLVVTEGLLMTTVHRESAGGTKRAVKGVIARLCQRRVVGFKAGAGGAWSREAGSMT